VTVCGEGGKEKRGGGGMGAEGLSGEGGGEGRGRGRTWRVQGSEWASTINFSIKIRRM